MANHQSALKRIRQTRTRRTHNKYYGKTMRNAIRKFRTLTDSKEAAEQFPKLVSIIDKNAKRGIIHKNKAGNLKAKLHKFSTSLS